MISAGEASPNAMVNIHHASDTIESITVKLILLYPETEIAEEETKDFVMTIVEQATVPEVMSSFSASMEIQVISAIKEIEPVENVFARM